MKTRHYLILTLIAILSTGCMTISTNGDYTLNSGRTLRGDLIMTSGAATIEEGSRVTGNVFMTSGTLNVDGQVDGDIIYSSAKNINLGPDSVVGGDIKGTSGNVHRSDGAQVGGEISSDHTFTVGAGFFFKAFGFLCGIPLVLIGLLVYGLTGRRQKKSETGPNVVDATPRDIPGTLKQLKQMQEEGLISEEDYEAKKADILRDL